MWCQPFPFTIRKISVYHPEYTRLHLYGQPKIVKSDYSNLIKANEYLIDLSSKNSFHYKKIVNVVLTLIDDTKLPFIVYIGPEVIMVIKPKIIEYYAIQTIAMVMKIASNSKAIPFSIQVMQDYFLNINPDDWKFN